MRIKLMEPLSPEEEAEIREEIELEWENAKRLWDGKPQLPSPKYRSIDQEWIPSEKSK